MLHALWQSILRASIVSNHCVIGRKDNTCGNNRIWDYISYKYCCILTIKFLSLRCLDARVASGYNMCK